MTTLPQPCQVWLQGHSTHPIPSPSPKACACLGAEIKPPPPPLPFPVPRRSPPLSASPVTATPSTGGSTWLCSSQGTTRPRSGPPRWLATARGRGSSSFTSWGQVAAGDRGDASRVPGCGAGREGGLWGQGVRSQGVLLLDQGTGELGDAAGLGCWGSGGAAALGSWRIRGCCWIGRSRGLGDALGQGHPEVSGCCWSRELGAPCLWPSSGGGTSVPATCGAG